MNEHAATPEQIRADAERQLAALTNPPPVEADPEFAVPARSALVAARIRATRKNRRWSLQRLSDALEFTGSALTPQQLSKAETGQRGVSIDELVDLAGVLDVTPEFLMRRGAICPTCAQEVIE